MTQKYKPSNTDEAIFTSKFGFYFGYDILGVELSTTLNDSKGLCYTGEGRRYKIEGDVSPLTNQKEEFKCLELEVYKVVF
jgi:hypothetical protein